MTKPLDDELLTAHPQFQNLKREYAYSFDGHVITVEAYTQELASRMALMNYCEQMEDLPVVTHHVHRYQLPSEYEPMYTFNINLGGRIFTVHANSDMEARILAWAEHIRIYGQMFRGQTLSRNLDVPIELSEYDVVKATVDSWNKALLDVGLTDEQLSIPALNGKQEHFAIRLMNRMKEVLIRLEWRVN